MRYLIKLLSFLPILYRSEIYRCMDHDPPHIVETYEELSESTKQNNCKNWKEIGIDGL